MQLNRKLMAVLAAAATVAAGLVATVAGPASAVPATIPLKITNSSGRGDAVYIYNLGTKLTTGGLVQLAVQNPSDPNRNNPVQLDRVHAERFRPVDQQHPGGHVLGAVRRRCAAGQRQHADHRSSEAGWLQSLLSTPSAVNPVAWPT